MFVQRDSSMKIVAVFACEQEYAKEYLADDNAELQAILNPAPTYKQLRSAEYPPMSDYLDAVVKEDQAQMQFYIDACKAVKAKYPKP